MHPLLTSIDDQEKGMNAWIGVLLTVSLGNVAFLFAAQPESLKNELQLWALRGSWLLLAVTIIACIVALFRPVALAQLKQQIVENQMEALVRMRTDPTVKVQGTWRSKILGLQMRIIHRCQRLAIYSFFIMLICTLIFAYLTYV